MAEIIIGNNCMIGPNVGIYTTGQHIKSHYLTNESVS